MNIEFYVMKDGYLPMLESLEGRLVVPVWSDITLETERAIWESFKGLPHLIPDGYKLLVVFRLLPQQIGEVFFTIFGSAVVKNELQFRPETLLAIPADIQIRFDEIVKHLNQ